MRERLNGDHELSMSLMMGLFEQIKPICMYT